MTISINEPCPHCGRFANRGVTIDAIILKDEKVLLIKRGVEPFQGYWGLPGGYVGWDETIADAVRREVKEELGVSVKSIKELKTYSDPNRHPKQCIDVPHLVEIEGDSKVGDDAVDFKYFPLSDLPNNMAFDHKQLLYDYLQDKEK